MLISNTEEFQVSFISYSRNAAKHVMPSRYPMSDSNHDMQSYHKIHDRTHIDMSLESMRAALTEKAQTSTLRLKKRAGDDADWEDMIVFTLSHKAKADATAKEQAEGFAHVAVKSKKVVDDRADADDTIWIEFLTDYDTSGAYMYSSSILSLSRVLADIPDAVQRSGVLPALPSAIKHTAPIHFGLGQSLGQTWSTLPPGASLMPDMFDDYDVTLSRMQLSLSILNYQLFTVDEQPLEFGLAYSDGKDEVELGKAKYTDHKYPYLEIPLNGARLPAGARPYVRVRTADGVDQAFSTRALVHFYWTLDGRYAES